MAKKKSPGGRRFTAAERKTFRRLLIARRNDVVDDVQHLENGSLSRSSKEASGDLSAVPFHMADMASDTYEQEFTLNLLQSENEELRTIGEALQRLDEGSYGTCVDCDKPIPKSRLKALPHATQCVECKRKQEEGTFA